MTVKELINRLQQINHQEMKVVVNGYEDGFDDIKSVKPVIACEKIDHEWWDGKYNTSENGGGTVMLLLSR